MKKVTGIGGIFFKCNNPEKIKQWYRDNLGFDTDEYGAGFEWLHANDTSKRGFTQWSPFPLSSEYMAPSEKEFMINYRVENLEELVKELEKASITMLDKMETYEYGKFIHILDPEGNKIELWEPDFSFNLKNSTQ